MTHTSGIRATTIRSPNGLQVSILNLGATIQRILVPHKSGYMDAVLGYDDPEDYRLDQFYMGCTLGPFANRIGGAQILLDGRSYELEANEQPAGNCLHSGSRGYHRRFWTTQRSEDGTALTMTCLVEDGETGFPGRQELTTTYRIVDDLSLQMDYAVISDKTTIVNMANHAYFNLDQHHDTIASHELGVAADHYTPVNDAMIPTGEIRSVAESDFDLRSPSAIGARIVDHNYVLQNRGGQLRRVAELYSPSSGLTLRVHTTQPGLQVYTGDNLSQPFRPRQGICLEAQGFPDSLNQVAFPPARLPGGETYRQCSVYEFLRS